MKPFCIFTAILGYFLLAVNIFLSTTKEMSWLLASAENFFIGYAVGSSIIRIIEQ